MLKEIRKKAGMTQEEAATILGISRRTYLKYENSIDLQKTLKGQYMIDMLKKVNLIDEEHGILAIDKIKGICEEVFKDYNIKYCYLFGSYAKGYAKDESDVDICINTTLTGFRFVGLVENLHQVLKKKVDVIRFNDLKDNLELINEIMKDGIKIYG